MLLRHATPRKNLVSIKRGGLLTAKRQGRLPAVWLHAPTRSAWAALHVVRRHGGRVENDVLEIDVPPGRFRRVIDFIEVAGPSVDEGKNAASAA